MKRQWKFSRIAFGLLLIFMSIATFGVQGSAEIKRVDIGKIPERYWIDDFMGCEIQAKGWLLAIRCKGNRIYVADLQSWYDEDLYAPQLYWKRTQSGSLKFNLQPVNQFTSKTSQFAWIEINGKRQTLAFDKLNSLLERAKKLDENINLNKATSISSMFTISDEVNIAKYSGQIFEDEVFEISKQEGPFSLFTGGDQYQQSDRIFRTHKHTSSNVDVMKQMYEQDLQNLWNPNFERIEQVFEFISRYVPHPKNPERTIKEYSMMILLKLVNDNSYALVKQRWYDDYQISDTKYHIIQKGFFKNIEAVAYTFQYIFVLDQEKLYWFIKDKDQPDRQIDDPESIKMKQENYIKMGRGFKQMFAVDHGNVTKVNLIFDNNLKVSLVFYGVKEPQVMQRETDDFEISYSLTDFHLIKGGQAIAAIDKKSSELVIHNICSHSEYLNLDTKDCEPCPDNYKYSALGGTECQSCEFAESDQVQLMCKDQEMYTPFTTRYELVDFSEEEGNGLKAGMIGLIIFGGIVAMVIIACFIKCCIQSELQSRSRREPPPPPFNAVGQQQHPYINVHAPSQNSGLSKEEQAKKFSDDVKANLTKVNFSKERTKSMVIRNGGTNLKQNDEDPLVYPPDAEENEPQNNNPEPFTLDKQMTLNKNKLFDISCTICMVEFNEGEPVNTTVCKHSFHEQCINQWIDKKVQNKVSAIRPSQESNTYNILGGVDGDGPVCPNCNRPLIQK